MAAPPAVVVAVVAVVAVVVVVVVAPRAVHAPHEPVVAAPGQVCRSSSRITVVPLAADNLRWWGLATDSHFA